MRAGPRKYNEDFDKKQQHYLDYKDYYDIDDSFIKNSETQKNVSMGSVILRPETVLEMEDELQRQHYNLSSMAT